ncbi:hypothetical protein E2562_013971 [Oryza meyeriana var. granulata]|uniref:Uncharacterized protein n=1 Tax=Oryza meyeriana var. granulata TaxID=110450 RepID=A0A6G1DIT0_9ORYZ|nr:hypothetical protein E2562_013971 [Oryza meyeriana var. granulata]
MGSLMAGWDSPVLGDDNRVRARRNKSLTREEVEAFWKQHGGEMPSSPLGSPAGAMARSASVGLSRAHASSSPRGGVRIDQATRVEGFFPDDEAAAAESPSKSRDWYSIYIYITSFFFLQISEHVHRELINGSSDGC